MLRECAAAALAELRERLELVEAREERDRLLAAQRAAFDGSGSGMARLRYEMAAHRVFRASLSDLRIVQQARRAATEADESSARAKYFCKRTLRDKATKLVL